ncbi:hypothetical protein TRM7557_02838 [Tritonibacter multivorans]|uniref:DUF4034 domain-containing protein n=1 Tax=Tritonibacter multivorans TaxID=928856 RepID=A0A0P1GF30_9RHOB|nr:hypothetical protein [Tritonibacter multivorans]MDA7421024.1 hypothetical protein [Tritonibacter multivorans]CUH80327.1 hypothetical protein TRM7557_02838 [Tritonibacter multivorans]SFC78138.1 hypothetical protein SAMN04488049_104121 [Tritonibacter multivorans]
MQFIANTAKTGIRHALRRAQAKVIKDKIIPMAQTGLRRPAADASLNDGAGTPGLLDQLLAGKASTAMRKALGGAQTAPTEDPTADLAAPTTDSKVSPARASLLKMGRPQTSAAPDRTDPAQRPSADTWLTLPEARAEGTGETQAAIDRGQFLARQDRWEELLTALIEADTARTHLPNGSALAELLAFGARCDVVNGLEHALREGCTADDPITLNGVMALERVRLELARAPLMTAVVAQTHIDFGWAFQTAARASSTPEAFDTRAQAHFDRAAALLGELDATANTSPLVLSARCALFSGQPATADQVADTYGALIALAPQNARHMRAFGNHLLPRWHGSYDRLETEARRIANRTAEHWGAAGYAWVYFDALALDPEACADMDLQLFLDGIADIVERGAEADVDQETVNLLAAYCLVTLRTRSASEMAAATYDEIAESAHWLVRNHLQELHPMVWAHAERGFANNIGVSSLRRFTDHGRQTAHAALATLFAAEIDAGQRVVFSPEGLQLAPFT